MVEAPSRRTVAALTVAVAWPAFLPPLTLFLSWSRVSISAPVAAVIVVAALFLAVLLARAAGAGARPSTVRFDPYAGVALLLVAAVATHHLVLTWHRPVLDWDGLYYHVPAVHEWLRAGRVVWIEGIDDVPFVNGYPMALETMGLLLVRLLDHDRWLDALNLLLWPAGALGLALTARVWGARRPWPAIAAVSFLAVPAWHLGSTTAYVDVGLAAATCAFVGVTAWRLRGADHVGAALLWGAATGLVAGVKGTGLLIAALGVALLVVDVLGRSPARRPAALRALGLGVAVLLVVGGPWPLRALLHTGNPVHPVELRLGAKVLAPGTDAHAAAALSTPEDVADLPAPLRPLAVWARPFRAVEVYDQAEGLGPVWTLGALPALLVLAATRRRREVLGPIALGALLLVSQPAPWWSRLTLWMLALGLPAIAAVASRPWGRKRSIAVRTVAGLVLLSGAFVGLRAVEADAARGRSDGGYVDAIRYYFPELAAHPRLDEALAAEVIGRTRWSREGSLLGGALAHPAGRRTVIRIDDPADAPDALRWILWDLAAAGEPPAPTTSGWRPLGGPRSGFLLLERTPARTP
jgi:hypothetical protein